MYEIMSEIAGPIRRAMMSAPDGHVTGRLDAHSDLAMLRRALQSAAIPFVQERCELFVTRADGEEAVFNAFEVQEDADILVQALHLTFSRFLWLRRITAPGGRRSDLFDDTPQAWRRAVVTFAASLPTTRS